MTSSCDGHVVTLLPGGESFVTLPGERILDAALRQGITLPHDCRQGTCGTCRAQCRQGSMVQVLPSDPRQTVPIAAGREVLTCLALAQEHVVLESAPVDIRYMPRKLPARVREITFLSDDVALVRLQLGSGQALAFRAGQYLKAELPGGIRRNYSFANLGSDGGGAEIELHIRRVPGGAFSNHVFERLKIRDVVRLEGPFGHFYLREGHAGPVVLLATGTGFAPIKSMLEQIQQFQDDREVSFYWGGRSLADLYLRQWVRELQTTMPRLRFIPVLSRQAGWTGRQGHVQACALADGIDIQSAHVYACGSPAMVEGARQHFCAAGLPQARFFADAFAPAAPP